MNFGKLFKAYNNVFNDGSKSIELFFEHKNRVSDLSRKQLLSICKSIRGYSHSGNINIPNDYMRKCNADLVRIAYKAMKDFERVIH